MWNTNLFIWLTMQDCNTTCSLQSHSRFRCTLSITRKFTLVLVRVSCGFPTHNTGVCEAVEVVLNSLKEMGYLISLKLHSLHWHIFSSEFGNCLWRRKGKFSFEHSRDGKLLPRSLGSCIVGRLLLVSEEGKCQVASIF